MEAAAAAFGLISAVLDLVKEAETASKERHDEIVARLNKTTSELQDALAAARAARVTEAQATQDAIDKAKQTP